MSFSLYLLVKFFAKFTSPLLLRIPPLSKIKIFGEGVGGEDIYSIFKNSLSVSILIFNL